MHYTWSIGLLLSNTISGRNFFFTEPWVLQNGIKRCSFSCCCCYRLGMTHGSLQAYWVHLIHRWPKRSRGIANIKTLPLLNVKAFPLSEDFTSQCTLNIYIYKYIPYIHITIMHCVCVCSRVHECTCPCIMGVQNAPSLTFTHASGQMPPIFLISTQGYPLTHR